MQLRSTERRVNLHVEWCFVIDQCHGNSALSDVGVDGALTETSLHKVPKTSTLRCYHADIWQFCQKAQDDRPLISDPDTPRRNSEQQCVAHRCNMSTIYVVLTESRLWSTHLVNALSRSSGYRTPPP